MGLIEPNFDIGNIKHSQIEELSDYELILLSGEIARIQRQRLFEQKGERAFDAHFIKQWKENKAVAETFNRHWKRMDTFMDRFDSIYERLNDLETKQ